MVPKPVWLDNSEENEDSNKRKDCDSIVDDVLNDFEEWKE